MNFNNLTTQLNLNSKTPIKEKLGKLRQWCQENVSQDISFEESPENAYENYKQLAEFYLDEILPNIPKKISEPSEIFDNRNIIQFAAETGLDRMIDTLAPDPESVNIPDENNMTPLHTAALEGFVHTTKILYQYGADPNTVNNLQQTPVFSALILNIDHDKSIKEQKIKIFRFLMTNAPNTLRLLDNDGNSILHLIALYGYESLITEVLTSEPTLFTTHNKHSHYPVHTAILNHQTECLRVMLEINGVETLTDASGETALHYAARYGSKNIIESCCQKFTNVDLCDLQGRTPLMLAAETGNIEAMEVLIKHKADPNLIDLDHNTLLHHAVIFEGNDTVKWILTHTSVEVNAQNYNKQTALQICKNFGQMEKILLLIEHGANASA